MCSVGDDFLNEGEAERKAENFMLKPADQTKLEKCNKCRDQKPVILLRHKDAYCRDCFLIGTNHKFKALLGKSKLIRPNDRVLVSYEVGHPSSALLHLLRTGLDLDTPKKLRFEPVVLFLEDQYHLNTGERKDMIDGVISDILLRKFKPHLVSFAHSLANNEIVDSDSNLAIDESDLGIVERLFAKDINESDKREVLKIFRRNILLLTAKKLECKFIFTPELSVDVAANLLTNISLGRGSQVPDDTGFCDERDSNVKILRPLRLFEMKELAFYNILHQIQPVCVRQPVVNPYSSIQSLMQQFIVGLQQGYPATVATVLKTGDKLALDESKITGRCKLCQGVVLMKTEELSSEESTNFSKLVSNETPDHSFSGEERFLRVKNKFDNRFCDVAKGREYCFSCSTIQEFLL